MIRISCLPRHISKHHISVTYHNINKSLLAIPIHPRKKQWPAVAMDKLSPEILSIIASYFLIKPEKSFIPRHMRMRSRTVWRSPRPDCGPYTLSRNWQYAVEAQTFSSIHLQSTELPEFTAIFSDSHRRWFLRELYFIVCLPTHGDSQRDHATNQAVFTNALKELFSLLALWDQQAAGDNAPPTLKLRVTCDYDVGPDADGPVELYFNVLKSSAARRYFEVDVSEFPSVPRVSAFHIDVSPGRAPHPTTTCRLAGLFPRLRELEIEYLDPAIKRRDMRKEHRLAFAAGLRSLGSLSELTKLHVGRQGALNPYNHSFQCQDLEDEEHVDPLCESIRQLAEEGRLVELDVLGVLISPDLFRNRRPGASSEHKPMSALRQIHVQDGLLAPSGKWYYTGNPAAVAPDSPPSVYDSYSEPDDDDDSDTDDSNSDSSDEDHHERDAAVNGEQPRHLWRTRPDTEMLDPLVIDMAKALHRMPALKRARLEISGDLPGPMGVLVQCVKGGEGFFEAPDGSEDKNIDKETGRCKAWVGATAEWEVPREAKDAMEEWLGGRGQVDVVKRPFYVGDLSDVTFFDLPDFGAED